MYKRQVNKLSLAMRVVDAQNTDRHYEEHDLSQLYSTANFEPDESVNQVLPDDKLLINVLEGHRGIIYKYHTHDSLIKENPYT